MSKVLRSGMLSGLSSLPWCCIVPGILSLVGLGSVGLARAVARQLMPLFLLVGVLFLGRAYYLLYVKHEGNRFSRVTTWVSTALLIGVSILRFWPW